jgi:SAM-dependent methyltransferase
MVAARFENVTELPGAGATPEGVRMLATRYAAAAEHAADADVLELGAGPGIGLGLLARKARRVVGTDLTLRLAREAKATHGARVEVAAADAQRIPFRDASFDLVILYEALYYVPDVRLFFRECRRVLRPGGKLILCTANKHRPGFVKSPWSVAYHDAAEISALYREHGFEAPELRGAFPTTKLSLKGRLLLRGFTLADRLRLIPRSLEGRARVKRLLYGDLVPTPRDLATAGVEPEPLHPWDESRRADWKVLYAVGRRAP